ncbi:MULTISPECIES: Flp family type IVb pilin [Spongiibacter]|jgi:pilus assembly protein Flp/PilA|uniref:Flp family type IVb pilin n=1 Tax=Spongiibacter TaxID=630749 RepID=UPI0003F87BB5|nr:MULTISPECIES: Flp family type IVb pilin [Spongiibacter]MAK43101.1 Flp family type IVb pilin [Spongiibacter sp.]|tara:strand:- start:7629 stop:7829 length:201 start_codon:yes stop_codon:yes gene_type:complete
MLVQIQVLLMQIFSGSLAKFRDDERGASAIEYAIMAAVLIGVIIAAIGLLDLGGIFTDINADIDAA